MGVVYEALEPGTRRPVALKVLDVAGKGYDLDLALREARLMAKVSHENTVFLYRAERTGSGLLLAMEIVRGGTVADLLRREGRLLVPRAAALTLQLIEGLRAYDVHGIVHRDIKPSNCFLDLDGRARIGDLGLSRSPETASRLTQEGRFLGTPHYSSPEQLRGEAVDRRSDIYSLGATLYEMIAGHPPIEAPDGVTLVARIMTEEPEPPSRRVPGVPPGLDEVVLRALAKRPDHRFTTYEEFIETLVPFAAPSLLLVNLGTRVAAAAGDFALFALMLEGLQRLLPADLRMLILWAPVVLIGPYFLLFEAVARASPMKAIFGLRIVARDGGRAGPGQALARALIKLVPFVLLMGFATLPTVLGLLGMLVLASTMLATGSEALHDRLTGTRVVYLPSKLRARVRFGIVGMLNRPLRLRWGRRRTALPTAVPAAAELPPADLRFGAFVAQHRLVIDDKGTLWAAEDPLLGREVWIQQHTRSEDRSPEARRSVDRPSRLRWIAAGESDGGAWDAFDAPDPGRSLWACSPRERRRPWREARRVLGLLAREVLVARGDGTLPPYLSLAQVITLAEGRTLLLDGPFERRAGEAEQFATDRESLRSFFQALVSALATGGVPTARELAEQMHLARLPVKDHRLIEELWNPSCDPVEVIVSVQRLADDPPGPVELNPSSRIKHFLGVAVIGGLAWIVELAFAEGIQAGLSERNPSRLPPLLVGILGLLLPVASALAFRGGLALRLEGVEVRTLAGRPASPWRLLVRSLPLALLAGVTAHALAAGKLGLAMLALGFALVAVLWAALSPARSPGDLLVHTYLRPK